MTVTSDLELRYYAELQAAQERSVRTYAIARRLVFDAPRVAEGEMTPVQRHALREFEEAEAAVADLRRRLHEQNAQV